VANVATAVLVGGTLHQKQRVTRVQPRLVGQTTRNRSIIRRQAILQDVISRQQRCISTLKTQITTAEAMKYVSAHSLVNRARTKINLESPPVKHV